MSSAINELKQRYPVAWLSGYRDRYLHWGFERVPTTKEYELGVRSPGFKKLVELQNWKIKSVSTDAMDWAGTWALVSKVPYFAACGEDALKKKFLRRSKRKSSVLIASNGLRTGLVYAFDDMSEIFAWAGDHEGVGHILACMLKQNAATANVIVPADGDAYTAVFEKLACDERVISRGNIAIINTEKFFSEFTCFGEAVCRKRLSGQIILNIAAACGFDPELIELCADGNELKVRKVNEISGPQLKLGRADLARLFFSINRLQVSSMLPGYAGWVSELGPVPLYIPPLYNI